LTRSSWPAKIFHRRARRSQQLTQRGPKKTNRHRCWFDILERFSDGTKNTMLSFKA
jgi:hypothetical protein